MIERVVLVTSNNLELKRVLQFPYLGRLALVNQAEFPGRSAKMENQGSSPMVLNLHQFEEISSICLKLFQEKSENCRRNRILHSYLKLFLKAINFYRPTQDFSLRKIKQD